MEKMVIGLVKLCTRPFINNEFPLGQLTMIFTSIKFLGDFIVIFHIHAMFIVDINKKDLNNLK